MDVVAVSKVPLLPSFSKVESEVEKKLYWESLLQDWKLPKHIKHFPGSHPVSIEEKDLKSIHENRNDFLVSLKTDGTRYIMYMTFRPESESPVTLLIDRAKNMYEIETWANKEYYFGTILDGELVWKLPNETQSTFLVFDVIKVKGIMKTDISYSQRLECIRSIIYEDDIMIDDDDTTRLESHIEECDKIVSMNNLSDLVLKSKSFAPLSCLQKVWNDRNFSSYRNDGLIITKNMSYYKHGSDRSTFKWKPTCSIDIVTKSNDIYANSNNSDELVKIKKVLDYTLVLEKNRMDYNSDQVIECDIKLSDKTIFLFPMRTRSDKCAPNTVKTIESTVKGFVQNISFNSLI